MGGGLIVDGRPLTGVAGFGGEVGHIPVNPNGVACQCGSVGCWETEVGEEALLRLAGHPPGGGWAEVDAVLEEARAGFDGRARRCARASVAGWASDWPAWSMSSTRGWSSWAGCSAGFIRSSSARSRPSWTGATLPGSRALVRIVPARLGVDAPLLGAAELAFEPLLADPAAWLRPRGVRAELASA